MNESMSADPRWWGQFRVPHGSTGCFSIGPMDLWVERLHGEWRVAPTVAKGAEERAGSVHIPAGPADVLAMEHVSRFGLAGDSETLHITPMLADRPVVTTPEKPLYIPARERVIVFVGSPLWLRLEVGEPARLLTELPIVRPSDTWFGPGPHVGELCYASRTACRLQLEGMVVLPHRALTAVEVHNRTDASFLLERMKLPVEYLPLFRSDNGAYWTRDVSFDRVADEGFAAMRHLDGKPAHAAGAELIAPARREGGKSVVVRAFTSLFT